MQYSTVCLTNEADFVGLSVLIPVYNCVNYIQASVDSVIAQASTSRVNLEILIFDGGSTDGTEKVAQRIAENEAIVRYVRQDHKGGIDRDLDSAVRLARGSYVLLLSGDDCIAEHALAFWVSAVLESKFDVCFCRHATCDIDLNSLGEYNVFDDDKPQHFDLHHSDERLRCFSTALNSEAIFSFMSGLLIRKSVWLETTIDDIYLSSCWGHVARLFTASKKQSLQVHYFGKTLVLRRGGNDSFATQGLVNRIAIAVDNLPLIFNDLYGSQSAEHHHAKRMVLQDIPFAYWLNAKALTYTNSGRENIQEFSRLVDVAHSDTNLVFQARRMAIVLIPASALAFFKRVWIWLRLRGKHG
jgi:abequosyltransferase